MIMKIVNLIGPAVIAGAVRYPIEGPLTVSSEEADRLQASGRLDGDPEDLPGFDEIDTATDDDLDGMTVTNLKAAAKDEGVDLGNASAKADIIAAIRTHRLTADA